MIRIVTVIMLSFAVIIVSWTYYQRVEDQTLRSSSKVRQAIVQRQQAEQRLRRLDDGQRNPLLQVLGEDVSAVQIRIAEYLAGSGAGYGSSKKNSNNKLIYEQSLLTSPLSTDGLEISADMKIETIRILRLDVQGQLAHAQAFINLLHGIYSEVGGWPIVVRACDLQKLPVQALKVRCVMDIYHWSAERHTARR